MSVPSRIMRIWVPIGLILSATALGLLDATAMGVPLWAGILMIVACVTSMLLGVVWPLRSGCRVIPATATIAGASVWFAFRSSLLASSAAAGTAAFIGFIQSAWHGLPLVIKELQEQSSRRRTWILRVVYAVLAFLTASAMAGAVLSRQLSGAGPLAILGHGRELFMMFVVLQFLGIYLFLPAMSCPLITSEKERDTLQLLVLTRLSPWGILWGKLLSRLVPMLMLLGLSFPLFALAYSLGGFEAEQIACALWGLTITMMQVSCLGLMCSAYFRTTAGALIATYLFGILMLFGPVFFDEATHGIQSLHEWLSRTFNGNNGSNPWNYEFMGFNRHDFSAMFVGVVVTLEHGPMGSSELGSTLLRSIPIVVLTSGFLLLSRLFLLRRANAPSRNLIGKFFKTLDRGFWNLNQRFGGMVLTSDKTRLPGDEPISWRETTRRPVGTMRYLIRLLILIELPVLFLCLLAVGESGSTGMLSFLIIMLWLVSTLFVCVASTSLIAGERTHQTLDVLLTTPLRSADILRQKTRGVRRLIFVLAVPLLTLYGFQTWIRLDAWREPTQYRPPGTTFDPWRERVLIYGLSGIVTVLIYLPMLSSLALLIGIRMKTQSRAVVATLAAVVGWCLLPILGAFILDEVIDVGWSQDELEKVLLSSPMLMIPLNEFMEFNHPRGPLLINSAIYLGFLLLFKVIVRTQFSSFFGRVDSARTPAARQPATTT